MSNSSGRAGASGRPERAAGAENPAWKQRKGGAAGSAPPERDAGDSLLRFLTRLSHFGLAAGSDPLLKPVKRAS